MITAWAGIDLGTQSIRAAVIDDTGHVTAASRPVTSIRKDTRHEQDPGAWLIAVRDVLRRVTQGLGASVRIEALAVSGTSGTIVPVDHHGRPAGMAVMYDDPRGRPYLDRVSQQGEALWTRLGYRMQPSWGLPKMVAMREEGALAGGLLFAHQPDVVTSWLAGRLLPSDLSSALKSGVDLDSIEWPTALLDELGLNTAALNTVAASGARIGAVSAQAAEATGLPGGCAIIAGMTDGCAAQIASGALEPGDWNSVLGTTLVLKGVSERRRTDPSGAVYAHRAPFNGGWYPGGASSTGARAVAELLPGADLTDVTQRAASIQHIPVGYPLVGTGERFPFVAPDAHGFGPDGHALSELNDDERFAAIAYGVAFIERLSMELVDHIGYQTSGRIFITGGGSRNQWWNQVRSNVQGRALSLPRESEGVVGMAILASAAVTEAVDPLGAAAGRLLRKPTTIEPGGASSASIEDAYGVFVARLKGEGWLTTTTTTTGAARTVTSER